MRVISRTAAAAGLTVAGLAACSAPDTSPLTFDFPPGAAAGTEILVVTKDRATSAFVVPLERPSVRLPLEVGEGATATLEAMIYDEAPAALGLAEGPWPALAEGTPTRPPHATYTAQLEGGRVSAWVDGGPPSATASRYQAKLPCAALGTPEATYGTEIYYMGAARVDGTTALMVTGTATSAEVHYYLADKTGARRITPPVPREVYPSRIAATPLGVLLAASSGPDLWRTMYLGDPRVGLEKLPPRPDASSCGVTGIDYAHDGSASPALYVIDGCGSLDRYLDGAWTHLRDGFETYNVRRRLAWVGPDELVFPGADTKSLWRYANGAASPMTSEVPADQVQTVATIDGYGTFAGLLGGWVLEYTEGGWRALRGPLIGTVSVEAFGRFGDNLLVGGSDGDIQHWVGRAACPATTYVGVNHNVLGLVELDDAVIATGVVGLEVRTFFASVLVANR